MPIKEITLFYGNPMFNNSRFNYFKFKLIIIFWSELLILSLAGIRTADLHHTKLMCYQLSCLAWIKLKHSISSLTQLNMNKVGKKIVSFVWSGLSPNMRNVSQKIRLIVKGIFSNLSNQRKHVFLFPPQSQKYRLVCNLWKCNWQNSEHWKNIVNSLIIALEYFNNWGTIELIIKSIHFGNIWNELIGYGNELNNYFLG